MDAVGLTRLITHLNTGESYAGKPIDAPTSFFVGVALNPTADDLDLEVDRFWQKVDAGARFAMTQIIFDLRASRRAALPPRGHVADPGHRRALPALDLPARAAAAQRGARDRRPGSAPGRAPGRRLGGGRDRARARANAARRAPRPGRRRVHRHPVPSPARSPRGARAASRCTTQPGVRGLRARVEGESDRRRTRGRCSRSSRARCPLLPRSPSALHVDPDTARRRRRRLGEMAHAPRPPDRDVPRSGPGRSSRHHPVAARQNRPTRDAGIYLHRAAQMVARGERVVLAVYGHPWQAPVDARQRGYYCSFLHHVVSRIPIRDVVVWNEVNSPQFWPASAGPAAYEALLARCWDRLRTVRPGVNLISTTAAHYDPAAFIRGDRRGVSHERPPAAGRAHLRPQPVPRPLGRAPVGEARRRHDDRGRRPPASARCDRRRVRGHGPAAAGRREHGGLVPGERLPDHGPSVEAHGLQRRGDGPSSAPSRRADGLRRGNGRPGRASSAMRCSSPTASRRWPRTSTSS